MSEEGKKSWFSRLKDGLKQSSSKLTTGIAEIFTKRRLDDDALEEFEDLLITSDLGVTTAAKLSAELDRWLAEQGDPGSAVDMPEALKAAREGKHLHGPKPRKTD